MLTEFLNSFAKPRRKSESIAPELPLAERRTTDAASDEQAPTVAYLFSSRLTAPSVRVIFIPVSPSGTGNTFILFIFSLLFSSALAPETSIERKVLASILVIPMPFLFSLKLSRKLSFASEEEESERTGAGMATDDSADVAYSYLLDSYFVLYAICKVLRVLVAIAV